MSHLLVTQLFEAVTKDRAAVPVALAAVGQELGHVVVKATVVLGGNRVIGRSLQRWRAVEQLGTLRFG